MNKHALASFRSQAATSYLLHFGGMGGNTEGSGCVQWCREGDVGTRDAPDTLEPPTFSLAPVLPLKCRHQESTHTTLSAPALQAQAQATATKRTHYPHGELPKFVSLLGSPYWPSLGKSFNNIELQFPHL